MKSKYAKSLLVASLLSAACTKANSADMTQEHFNVAVQNVTAGNLLSPYLVIVHKADTSLIDIGTAATAGLQQIAETGATDLIQAELAANPNVLAVMKAAGTPLIAAETRGLEFDIPTDVVNSGALVTVIAMIGKSNDSFIAARALPLSSFSAKATTIEASNLDAGTEENTGNVEDLNAVGHPVATIENHISYDRGLNPNGNAPEILRWGSVAALVKISR